MSTSGSTGYTSGSYPTAEGDSPGQSWTDECCAQMAKAVDENPTGTLLTAFGAGLGIGALLALSVTLTAAPKRKPKSFAEQIGDRVLESLQDILPESIARKVR